MLTAKQCKDLAEEYESRAAGDASAKHSEMLKNIAQKFDALANQLSEHETQQRLNGLR